MSALTIYITVKTISIENHEHSMYACHFIHLYTLSSDRCSEVAMAMGTCSHLGTICRYSI